MKIKHIRARQILDSRGNPTVEADVWLDSGVFGRAAVPSGASTGVHEAHELRDGGKDYDGKGVLQAVKHVETKISDLLKGVRADDQNKVDSMMCEFDGTENKSKLGANAILAVSLACAHAAAKQRDVLLYAHINDIAHNPEKNIPVPMMNVLNGGKHANNSADFQEYMIMPMNADSYQACMKLGMEVFQALKGMLHDKGLSTTVGDEGGFALPVNSNVQMLDMLQDAAKLAGYKPDEDVAFALDVAASEFYADGSYDIVAEKRRLGSKEMIAYLKEIADKYPVISIEDGLDQDDWDGWAELHRALPDTQLVGDDFLVTNAKRLKQAISMQAGNSILIKPNQIGTLSETIEAILIAKQHGWNPVVSHRSGETEDISIAHIAVGTGAGQIKTGSLSRGERTAKHNELLRIEEIDPALKLARPFS